MAHARIVSIAYAAAEAVDGVVAVVTVALLAKYNLAWMPTLSGDTQAVLATDKVRFQGHEIMGVIGTDRYIAELSARETDSVAIPVDAEHLPSTVMVHVRDSAGWTNERYVELFLAAGGVIPREGPDEEVGHGHPGSSEAASDA